MPTSTFTSISSSRTPVVYANKGSCLIAAVQSFYTTEVNVQPLSELMKVRPEVDVPTLTSFWLDLPQKSWPNRTPFIDHMAVGGKPPIANVPTKDKVTVANKLTYIPVPEQV